MKSFIYALALAALLCGNATARPKLMTKKDAATFESASSVGVLVIIGTGEGCYWCKVYKPTVREFADALEGTTAQIYVYDIDAFELAGRPTGIPFTLIRAGNRFGTKLGPMTLDALIGSFFVGQGILSGGQQ